MPSTGYLCCHLCWRLCTYTFMAGSNAAAHSFCLAVNPLSLWMGVVRKLERSCGSCCTACQPACTASTCSRLRAGQAGGGGGGMVRCEHLPASRLFKAVLPHRSMRGCPAASMDRPSQPGSPRLHCLPTYLQGSSP